MRRRIAVLSFAAVLMATSPGAADQFEDALSAYNRGDYTKALKLWRPLADQGMPRAQYDMGLLYFDGKGVSKDLREALRWFRLSADQGFTRAQSFIGSMYALGDGVAQDYVEAEKWFRRAAGNGDASSQDWLGVLYANGHGVSKDLIEAVRFFHLAADQNLALAQYHLGVAYYGARGVPQDYVQAAAQYSKAAHQGLAAAQFNLGIMYYKGEGVSRNETVAKEWLSKAADQGDAHAKDALAKLFPKQAPEQGTITSPKPIPPVAMATRQEKTDRCKADDIKYQMEMAIMRQMQLYTPPTIVDSSTSFEGRDDPSLLVGSALLICHVKIDLGVWGRVSWSKTIFPGIFNIQWQDAASATTP